MVPLSKTLYPLLSSGSKFSADWDVKNPNKQSILSFYKKTEFILMGKREVVALLSLSSWCLVIIVWLFLAVPLVCLHFVIVVFSDHTHYLDGEERDGSLLGLSS